MPKLPVYLPNQSAETGSTGPQASGNDVIGGRGSILAGRSVENAAGNLAEYAQDQQQTERRVREMTLHQQNVISELAEQKTRQIESLEINQKTSQLRTDWNKRLIQYQQNPPDNLLDTATSEYDDYVGKMIQGSSTQDVKDSLALHASEFRIQYVNDVFRLQSQVQLARFGASFDKMLSNAEDSLFSTKSVIELVEQKFLLNKTISQAVATGQIRDPQIVQNLRDKTDLLSVSWAEAVLPDNPELVRQVVNGDAPYQNLMDGVSSSHKSLLLNKAKEVENTHATQEKLLLREALESDKVQRVKTGSGSALNLERFEQVFGKPARDAAERELNNASKLHSFNELAQGADGETLQKIVKDAEPKSNPTSTTYHEEQDLADNVHKIVANALNEKKDDAFTYFSQNPAVKPLAQRVLDEPTEENQKVLEHAVLDLQHADKSLNTFEYRVMPKAQAEKFIAQFNNLIEVGNKADGAGVRDLLVNFSNQYKDNIHIALNQLSETQGGEKVTPKINPLMWHLNNPSVFRLIIDAIRKDPQEAYARFGDDKVKRNFLDEYSMDSNLLMYQASIYSSDNSSKAFSLVGGVKDVFRDFSRDYVLNGGKLGEASQIFFQNYTWGSLNGGIYARPKNYTDNLGKSHVMSDDQANLSNSYLSFYPRTLDPEKIAPESILNETRFFTSDQIHKDTQDALRSNVFWSTTEDETGVYLFTKGTLAGTARQVFYKDGNPVRVNFVDTMKSIPMIEFGSKREKFQENTGDSALDRLSSFLLRN